MSEYTILQASLKLFARYGYDYVSVRQIASEANVNIGSISYYFESKSGILHRIIDDYYKGLNIAIKSIINDSTLRGREATQKLTQTVIEYMYSNLDATRINIREISLETDRFEKKEIKYSQDVSKIYIDYFTKIGIKEPKISTLMFVALLRMPFADRTLLEYFGQPFTPQSYEEFSDIVVSSIEMNWQFS